MCLPKGDTVSMVRVGRWQTVTALAAALAATAAIVANLGVDTATHHVWALAVLVLSAAVLRALGAGGPRSVLALAATMLVAQPTLHIVGEITHSHELSGDHGSSTGLLVIASHLALFVFLTAIIEAGERAGRALLTGLRRLARVLVWSLATPERATVGALREPLDVSHKQRERAPQPRRRGPPRVATVVAS